MRHFLSSQSILWEEHKAVIRGQCIAIVSRIKNDVALQVDTLSLQLQALEAKLVVHPTKRTLRRILDLRAKLRTLAMGKAEKLLLYSRQRYY